MRSAIYSMTLLAALLLAVPVASKADDGSYTYAGGTFSTSSVVGQNIAVTGAPLSASGATLSLKCPITSYGAGTYGLTWTCAGGIVTIATANNSLVFHGTFVSGSMSFSGSGGGRYGHTTYTYSFAGTFSGTVHAGGMTQAANGSLAQYVKTSTQIGAGSAPVTGGSLGWNSAYSPLLMGDSANGRVVAMDGISGANLSSFGKLGVGTGYFESIAGLTEDRSGRIYVTDAVSNHLVRVDNMTGANWTQIGSKGVGTDHFSGPQGVAIDAAGKIWVADTGNNRIVRMDDMSGTNWTSFGVAGSGANQFNGPVAIAFDAKGRIYVADKGNNRLVRFDNLSGANWVTLTEVISGIYGHFLYSPQSVQVNAAGQIFVGTGATTGYLIRVDDMTGANPVLSSWSGPVSSVSVDRAGTIYVTGGFTPGLAEMETASGVGYFGFGGMIAQPGPVYAVATPTPTPAAPVLSATGLAFGNENVGESSVAQSVTLTNQGATTLVPTSITTSTDYQATSNCLTGLAGGASCTLHVLFHPQSAGSRVSALTVNSNGVHPALKLALSGNGTVPKAVLLPAALNFDPQLIGTAAGAQVVTLTNSGTGRLTIKSIVASGDYSQTNNCGTGLQAGGGCVISVVFKPTAAGARNGAVTITDDASPNGAQQVVALTGTGTATAALFRLSPESVHFAGQEMGTTSVSQAVTLTNASAGAVTLGKPTYPAGFKVTTNCGATLGKGASCVFNAAFAPTVIGPVAGAIQIPVSGQGTVNVGLAGTGLAAGGAAVLVVSPATLQFGPITVGDNPSMNITVANPSGLPVEIQAHSFAGDSTLSVTGYNCPVVLGPGASCTVQITFLPLSSSPFGNNATFKITEGSGALTQVGVNGQAVANGN